MGKSASVLFDFITYLSKMHRTKHKGGYMADIVKKNSPEIKPESFINNMVEDLKNLTVDKKRGKRIHDIRIGAKFDKNDISQISKIFTKVFEDSDFANIDGIGLVKKAIEEKAIPSLNAKLQNRFFITQTTLFDDVLDSTKSVFLDDFFTKNEAAIKKIQEHSQSQQNVEEFKSFLFDYLKKVGHDTDSAIKMTNESKVTGNHLSDETINIFVKEEYEKFKTILLDVTGSALLTFFDKKMDQLEYGF